MHLYDKQLRNILPDILCLLTQTDIVMLSRCNKELRILVNTNKEKCNVVGHRQHKIKKCAALNHVICLQKYELKSIEYFNLGLYGACEGGHLELAKLMIEKGANDFNSGLYGACEKGHFELVNLMLEKGANDFNWGLRGACEKGHFALANLMLEKGADDFNWGLYGACKEGYLELAKLIIEKGATKCGNCDSDAANCRSAKK